MGAVTGDPQSWNGYAYARNNPLLYVDPDGTIFQLCDSQGNCQFISDADANQWRKQDGVVFKDGTIYDKDKNKLGTYERVWFDDLSYDANMLIFGREGLVARSGAMQQAIALFAVGTYGAGGLIGLGAFSPAAIPLAVTLLNQAGAWQQALSSETAPGPPNPNGRKGSPAHQAKVAEIEADIRSRGLKPRTEYRVETVNGQKEVRYIDVVATDSSGRVVETHQVGRTLSDGKTPVSRERTAYRDVRNSPSIRGAKRVFHKY